MRRLQAHSMKYILPALLSLIGLFFIFLFYERYWKYRECIPEALSSCVTPDGANLIAGGAFWSLFAFIFIGLAGLALWLSRHR